MTSVMTGFVMSSNYSAVFDNWLWPLFQPEAHGGWFDCYPSFVFWSCVLENRQRFSDLCD